MQGNFKKILFPIVAVFLFVLLNVNRSPTTSSDNVLMFDIQNAKSQTEEIKHQTEEIKHQTEEIKHQTEEIEPQIKQIEPQIKSKSYPNIIFMMIDDQGYSDMGYNSLDLAKCTPNLDTLASEGIKFSQYYSMHICTPARAALLTGLYPIHNGLYHEVIQPNQLLGLSLDYELLPSVLGEIGYDTLMIGKWHLGHYALNYTPTERGFNNFYGYYTDQEFYIEHANDHETYVIGEQQYYYYDFVLNNNIRLEDRGILSTDLFKEKAELYLQEQTDDTPFFLYLAWQNVHGPLEEVPDSYFTDDQLAILENITTVNDRDLLARLTMVLDDSIGSIVSTLKEMSFYENTILIVASDNGGCPCQGGYSYPLRGRKHTLFEGGSRVNAFIYSPLLSSSVVGTSYDNMFHVTDWFPTIVGGIVGRGDLIEDKNLDGISHWSAIQGKSDEAPRTEMVYNIDIYTTIDVYQTKLGNLTTPLAAIRVGDLKYITGEADSGWFWPSGMLSSNRSADYSALYTLSTVDCMRNVSENASYLFNLSSDPYEMYNLVDSEPELTAYMQTKLEEYMETMVEVSWASEDDDALDTWDGLGYVIYPWVQL